MVFCKKCGAELNEGTRFCKLCGTPVSGVQTSPSASEDRSPVPVAKKTFVLVVEEEDNDDSAPASSPISNDKKRFLGGIWGLSCLSLSC